MLPECGLVVVDDDRRYLVASRRAVALLGAHASAVLRSRLDDDVPPEHRPAIDRLWAKFRETGGLSGNAEVLRRDGGRTAVELKGTWNFGVGQHLIVGRRVGGSETVASSLPTTRELDILQLAAGGLTTAQIASRLVISPATVKTHFQNVYPKLGARDRTSAVAEALRRGLIS